jgi:hypothetical protein
MDEIEGCEAHPAEVAIAHAHDRGLVRSSAGADHGVVPTTAWAWLRQSDGQADEGCIVDRHSAEHLELRAHGLTGTTSTLV